MFGACARDYAKVELQQRNHCKEETTVTAVAVSNGTVQQTGAVRKPTTAATRSKASKRATAEIVTTVAAAVKVTAVARVLRQDLSRARDAEVSAVRRREQ